MTGFSARSTRILAAAVLLVAAVAVAGRLAAPSDLWDQTQPRTIAYTVDMLVRGGSAWILARDALDVPATKPPLVNWLAAPSVALLGRGSEFAHRLPSLLAAAAVVVLLVRVGERFGRGVGWLAALAWLATYATFKLFALVRPDMPLVLVALIGWLAAVRALSRDESDARAAALFWASATLAAWAKGPVAVLLPAFAVVASLWLHGSLRPLLRLHPIVGAFAFLLVAPSWYVLAALVDPEHVRRTLLGDEVLGRVSGLGPEGGGRGPLAILLELWKMPFYFASRSLPWSIAAILAMLALVDRRETGRARWRSIDGGGTLLCAALWLLLVIGAFSLSSGKRADYVAPALPMASLLAAWWLTADRYSPLRLLRGAAAPVLAAISIAIVGTLALREFSGPVYDRETVRRFDEVIARTKALPPGPPLVVVTPQLTHFPVLLGTLTPRDQRFETLRERLARGEPTRALLADPRHATEIAELLARPDARVLFSVEHGPDALRLGYVSPVLLVEFGGRAAVSGR